MHPQDHRSHVGSDAMTDQSNQEGGLLYLRDLAKRFGREWNVATRFWLIRALKKREQRCGEKLLLRMSDTKGARWYTTEALLRRGFPELVEWDREIVDAARSEVDELREQLCVQQGKLDAIARIVADLRANSRNR
jgi:hypothetical protein